MLAMTCATGSDEDVGLLSCLAVDNNRTTIHPTENPHAKVISSMTLKPKAPNDGKVFFSVLLLPRHLRAPATRRPALTGV